MVQIKYSNKMQLSVFLLPLSPSSPAGLHDPPDPLSGIRVDQFQRITNPFTFKLPFLIVRVPFSTVKPSPVTKSSFKPPMRDISCRRSRRIFSLIVAFLDLKVAISGASVRAAKKVR